MKYYELWDSETANLVAEADTLVELLTFVRDMIKKYDIAVATTWGLLWADDTDEEAGGLIARGPDLVKMAKSQVPVT